MKKSKPNIVIIGGGFAGLSCLLSLLPEKNRLNLTLIDERPAFEYTPALHDVLLNPERDQQITLPFTRFAENYLQARVAQITQEQIITDTEQKLNYDIAVVATGSATNFFGNESFQKYSYELKSLTDVKHVRTDIKKAKKVTIIGGGYTGVEIASVLATETKKKIQLVHSRERVLDKLDPKVSKYSQNYLETHGVKLYLRNRATEISRETVTLQSGKTIKSDLTILSSGISPKTDIITKGKVEVSQTLTWKDSEKIFLCGDAAVTPALPTAHNAMIEGRFVAQKILERLELRDSDIDTKQERDWRILVVALGRRDGIITFGDTGMFPLPRFTGFAKWLIERRVMFEFQNGIRLPI